MDAGLPAMPCGTDVPEGFRSGFVALVGRPNAGQVHAAERLLR
ncbi:MAG: hypothetical protein ACLTSX_14210 [Collinsella sp.]